MFCIINKMKTPLGKPIQTFAALAGELLQKHLNLKKKHVAGEVNRLAKEVMSRKPQREDKNSSKIEENGSMAGQPLKYSVQWLRVHLLLKLIEVLEKLMNSAIHGGSSAFNLCEIPVVCWANVWV